MDPRQNAGKDKQETGSFAACAVIAASGRNACLLAFKLTAVFATRLVAHPGQKGSGGNARRQCTYGVSLWGALSPPPRGGVPTVFRAFFAQIASCSLLLKMTESSTCFVDTLSISNTVGILGAASLLKED
jgi:hypothetical protein